MSWGRGAFSSCCAEDLAVALPMVGRDAMCVPEVPTPFPALCLGQLRPTSHRREVSPCSLPLDLQLHAERAETKSRAAHSPGSLPAGQPCLLPRLWATPCLPDSFVAYLCLPRITPHQPSGKLWPSQPADLSPPGSF